MMIPLSTPSEPVVEILAGGKNPPTGLRLSVIIPFGDVRGDLENVDGWFSGQGMPDGEYQLVTVTNGSSEVQEQQILARLRPQDLLLRCRGLDRFSLYSVGGRAAQASLLLFSEDHCVPQSGTLAGVLAYFAAHPSAQAATLKSTHINRSRVARMEQLINEEDSAVWDSPEHWNKVRIRGFVIGRQAYEDAGGFDHRYSAFSEAAFAAEIHRRGIKVGIVPEGGVGHINSLELGEIRDSSRAYTLAECDYCEDHDPVHCDRYFRMSSFFNRVPRQLAPHLAGAMAQTLWQSRGLPSNGEYSRSDAWRYFAWLLVRALCGPWERPLSRFRETWAHARFQAWWFSEKHQLRAVKDYWRHVVATTRLDHARSRAPRHLRQGIGTGEHESFVARGGYGVHGIEEHQGRSFRWCSPAALVSLRMPPSEGVVTIDTGALRGSTRGYPLGIFWNRVLVPRDKIRCRDGVLRFKVKKNSCRTDGHQLLTIIAAPAPAHALEARDLGLPVYSISFTRVMDGTPPAAADALG